MLQYKDYLKRVIEYCSAESEESFNEIVELFPNVQEIDWDDYYPDSDDPISYILKFLISSVNSNSYVDEYSEYDKSVTLEYVNSLKELKDLEDILNNNGWTIDNYEDLEEEIKEEEERLKEEDYKNSLLQEIRNKATLDQLEEFIKDL